VTTNLLHRLLAATTPPAILLGYLGQSLQSSLTSSQTLLHHVLFLISDNKPPSTSLLVSLSTLILSNLPENYTLPSVLARPKTLVEIPDIGTSASATPPPSTSSTLGLLLPLLRQCSSSTSPAPTPLILLIHRLLVSLQPYPAPPLDVGLEAGGLFQSLPETLSVPLRDCLSGLMADLAVSQDPSQAPPPPVIPPTIQASATNGVSAVTSETNAKVAAIPQPALPPLHTQLPIQHALSFEISSILRSDRWTRSDLTSDVPAENHLSLLKIGRLLSPDPSAFLAHLLRACLKASSLSAPEERVARWLFVTERLPVLLKWWKDNSDPSWAFPVCHGLGTARAANHIRTLSAMRCQVDSKMRKRAWPVVIRGYRRPWPSLSVRRNRMTSLGGSPSPKDGELLIAPSGVT
jgi:mediator of RNA polymerase II transcription subunit 5